MKKAILVAATALCCSAFAQAPAGVNKNPPHEVNPTMSGGKAQANSEKDKSAVMGDTATMGNRAMDVNRDGMITKKEWNAYHTKMWSDMKPNKQGMVAWDQVDTQMRGTPK
jgi:opacity protein-like surface antigen